jgi:hypothetical protein
MTKILKLNYKTKPELNVSDVEAIAKATDTTIKTIRHLREVDGFFGKRNEYLIIAYAAYSWDIENFINALKRLGGVNDNY